MRGRAYSVDLRERIVRAVRQVMSQSQAARQFSVTGVFLGTIMSFGCSMMRGVRYWPGKTERILF